jgi:hypothetical protein
MGLQFDRRKIKYKVMNQDNLKKMIESCYTYGGADVGSFNYIEYILPYRIKLGEQLFNKIYKEHLTYLKENAVVEHAVFTDSEGLTYNSLKRK